MSEKSLATSDFFLVYPDNAKLVSGETSFEQSSQRALHMAVAIFAIVVALVAVVWLLYANHVRAPLDIFALVFVGFLLTIFLVSLEIDFLYTAWLHRRLGEGQMIDASVVYSRVYFRQEKGGSRLWLEINYALNTPTGMRIQRTIKTRRNDIWEQAPKQMKGMFGAVRRWTGKEDLQILAPESGTTLIVRYVNDRFFRVM